MTRLARPRYGCFETANGFANALWDRSWCGVVARRALAEPQVAREHSHLGKGLYFYLEVHYC